MCPRLWLAVAIIMWLQVNVGSCATLTIEDAATNLTQLVLNCTFSDSAHQSNASRVTDETDLLASGSGDSPDTSSTGSTCDILLLTDLLLDTPVTFLNLNSTSIHGVHRTRTITCTSGNAGFIFSKTLHVDLRAVKIVGCATIKRYTYRGNQMLSFISAVHIVFTQYVNLQDVTVTDSDGTGVLLAYNSQTTNITDCKFISNRLVTSDESAFGGGGVYLQVQSTAPHSCFNIVNCIFSRNVAQNTVNYTYLYVDESGNPIEGRGRGGGMFVNIQRNVTSNSVTLSNCTFTDNTGFLGSGLSVEIEDGDTQQNNVIVKESDFVHNGCREGGTRGVGSGGGVQVSFRTDNASTNRDNTVMFQDVMFRENCALLGGGTYFFSNLETDPNTNNQIIFDTCTWLENHARTGSAVDITPDIFERLESGYSSVPVFRDCVFANNSIATSISDRQQHYGTGTLYSSLYDIKFESTAEFITNLGTALHVVNAIANFTESSALFIGNEGVQGGGVALIGTSSILIGPHRYTFRNNIATDKGGAIYSYLVDSHDFVVSRSCFLQYTEGRGRTQSIPSTRWKATVYFEGNHAHSHEGHDIFTSSLLPCQVVNLAARGERNQFEVLDFENIFQPPGVIFQGKADGWRLSTDGATFTNITGRLEVIPGEQFHHGVYVVDDLNHTITSMLAASFPYNNGNIRLDDSSTCLTNQIIQLKGTPHAEDTLLLQDLSTRRIFLTLDVTLLECPPGYTLAEDQCVCDAHSHTALVRCDDKNSFLRRGFWTGYINTSMGALLATTICPFGFCSYEFDVSSNRSNLEIALPRSRGELERVVCGVERSGILCGKCNPGYVVHFHSPSLQCEAEGSFNCNHLGWLFYILSEIVPATTLFVVILVFNISFTSGALNGFILFSQVLDTFLIDASGVIIFTNNTKHAIDAIRLVYGFFNLDFFYLKSLSFCIWKSASVMDILAFKYLTIGYSVVLIAAVIIFLKHCGARCLGRYYRVSVVRNSVIQGLSTFLVMCYTQCVKVSFSLLYYGTLYVSPAETNMSVPKRVWFNGELEFFSADHLPYALPALAILLIVGVIPPLILLTYPAIFRILACLKIPDSCIDKFLPSFSTMKPFLDAFQGSFKDNFRFFAGLYFLYRWIGVLVYAVITSYAIFYAVLGVLLVLMLALHALCQPYRNKWHNVLDTLLLADLALINIITAAHYYASRVDSGQLYQSNIENTGVIQVLLIYLPVIYFLIYVMTQIVKKSCWKRRLAEFKLTETLGGIFKKEKSDDKKFELELELKESDGLPYRRVGQGYSRSIVSVHDNSH